MTILELCPSLSTAQVLKIIKSYTLDDCENAIEHVFIEKLTIALNKRSNAVSFLNLHRRSPKLIFPNSNFLGTERCVHNG